MGKYKKKPGINTNDRRYYYFKICELDEKRLIIKHILKSEKSIRPAISYDKLG